MEIVSLDASVDGGESAGTVPGVMDPGFGADSEGTLYPYKWFRLLHPGGPGCKNDKDFAPPGYDFIKNCQCKIQFSIQVNVYVLSLKCSSFGAHCLGIIVNE